MGPQKRLRHGKLIDVDPQVIMWRRFRKKKGVCAAKPKKEPAPVSMRNIFAPDEDPQG